MSSPFIGEIRIFAFTFAPKGWAQCNGQVLAISQNQALFALLGTMYGGDGITTFALPNLQGRVPAHIGGAAAIAQGQALGAEVHTLSQSEMAAHTHPFGAITAAAATDSPADALPAATGSPLYASGQSPSVTLSPQMIGLTGGGQPHENRQPFLVLNVCIALTGIFPSRS